MTRRPDRSLAVAALAAVALSIAALAMGARGDASECSPGRLVEVTDLGGCEGGGVPALFRIAGGGAAAAETGEPGAAAVPLARNAEQARAYADERAGTVSFAALDEGGEPLGAGLDRPYVAASLVKAMLLVAFLDAVESAGDELTDPDRARLDRMISVSDNDAASAIYERVGEAGLVALAGRAGMEDFSVSGTWGNARVTAADQARFFLRLDELIPAAHRGLARDLLSGIAPAQTWGIPDAARPRWRVFFKGGWRPTKSGQLVHQGARLERDGSALSIAVLSDGSPSMEYGVATVRGVAERLLERP